MKCHYTIYEGQKIFIPYCYDGMAHGEEDCTCNDMPKSFQAFEKKEYHIHLKQLQEEIEYLYKELQDMVTLLEENS